MLLVLAWFSATTLVKVQEKVYLNFPVLVVVLKDLVDFCEVIFVILHYIASCCPCSELNMPDPSEGESPTPAQNLPSTQTRCDHCACKYTASIK